MTANENGSSLFVGNYDNGIVVPNICNAFRGKTTGKLAKKCIEVAPRAVHYLNTDDAAVLYAPLPESYAAYVESLYGFRPRTFAPRRQYSDLTEPLSLLQNILEDEPLLSTLSEEGRRLRWRLRPFIGHPLVHDLSGRTGLPVDGMVREDVMAGKVADFNNKALFQKTCAELGIPVVPSRHVRGWDNLVSAAAEEFGRHGRIMLRQASGAGGLGNCEVSAETMEAAGVRTVAEYLEKTLVPRDEWGNDTILVEPFLKVVSSPSVLMFIGESGVRFVADTVQIIKNHAYIGGIIPSGLPAGVLATIAAHTRRYIEWVRQNGGSGYVNVDWGLLDDGSVVAFESNYRYGGNNHPLAIRSRLRPGLEDRTVSWSNDALKVGANITFEQALDFVEKERVGWNRQKGEGVVISIPPAGGSMGYVALAMSYRRAREFSVVMEEFAASTRK